MWCIYLPFWSSNVTSAVLLRSLYWMSATFPAPDLLVFSRNMTSTSSVIFGGMSRISTASNALSSHDGVKALSCNVTSSLYFSSPLSIRFCATETKLFMHSNYHLSMSTLMAHRHAKILPDKHIFSYLRQWTQCTTIKD